MKVITSVQHPSTVQFDVLEQDIGIEPCFNAVHGSYRIESSPREHLAEAGAVDRHLLYHAQFVRRPAKHLHHNPS